MDTQTIQALNTLNARFYERVGVEFDRTRQQYWEGWDRLLPYFKNSAKNKKAISALDLACGNARFGRYIDENLYDTAIEYTGIEREPQLLELSMAALSKTKLSYTLQPLDIIQSLIDDTFTNSLKTYDLIMVFGLLHHVPSLHLRNKLIAALSNALNPGGLLVITSWQFALLPRFSERFASPKIIDIDPTQLEENDYILDWQRVEKAYRYCHFANEQELRQLIIANTDCTILETFYADGKTHSLNCYALCQK